MDAETGLVFHPENFDVTDNLNVAEDVYGPEDSLVKYRADSRLLIVFDGINENHALRGISYFVREDKELKRIKFVPKPYRF